MSYDPEPEIRHYLERLSSAAHDLPKASRRELLDEIDQHIRHSLAETAPTTRDEMLALLEQVGDPAEIAAAADDRADERAGRRSGLIAYLRRRPLRVILGAAALTVIGLAIGSVAWIQSYQPLLASGSLARGGRVPVAFHPGVRFNVGIDVQNNGRFTVRVLGVPYRSGPFAGLPVSARVMMSRAIGRTRKGALRCGGVVNPFCGVVAPKGAYYEPFHPFDLQPGRVRTLVVVGVYGNCADERNLVPISVPDLPVRYSFLWKTTTAHVALPKTREIIPPSGGCPSAVELAHRLNAGRPAGQTRVFKPGTIKSGVRLLCLGHETQASTLVPTRGQTAVGTANGPDGHATLRIDSRADGSVVAHCTSGDLPAG